MVPRSIRVVEAVLGHLQHSRRLAGARLFVPRVRDVSHAAAPNPKLAMARLTHWEEFRSAYLAEFLATRA